MFPAILSTPLSSLRLIALPLLIVALAVASFDAQRNVINECRKDPAKLGSDCGAGMGEEVEDNVMLQFTRLVSQKQNGLQAKVQPDTHVDPLHVENHKIDRKRYAEDWAHEWRPSNGTPTKTKVHHLATIPEPTTTTSAEKSGTCTRRTGTIAAAVVGFALLQTGLRGAVLICI